MKVYQGIFCVLAIAVALVPILSPEPTKIDRLEALVEAFVEDIGQELVGVRCQDGGTCIVVHIHQMDGHLSDEVKCDLEKDWCSGLRY